ncbi:hypothetical protein N9E86_00715 [Alphaproteobacteria bacterium]|nr:hypothetical protein [Alphaproteobacteria bacterium]
MFSSAQRPICFVASARDYHAIDWYRSVKKLNPGRRVFIATDSIQSEGAFRLVDEKDEIFCLFDCDKFLFDRQSKFADVWRNLIKICAIIFVAYRLHSLSRKNNIIFHAHSLYYIGVCWIARVKFIATPMGSDVLVRPDNSLLYRIFAIFSLRAAETITVDSIALQKKVRILCGRSSDLIQNGIDTEVALTVSKLSGSRDDVVSFRGMYPNYRLHELLDARNTSQSFPCFIFLYPFSEEGYLAEARRSFVECDKDYGRVGKNTLFHIFSRAFAVFSIPISDSSPRSVYEAIFCGSAVIVTYGEWIEILPKCMRERLIIVDLTEENWFDDAIRLARKISSIEFNPSKEAVLMFDEVESMKNVCAKYYTDTPNE